MTVDSVEPMQKLLIARIVIPLILWIVTLSFPMEHPLVPWHLSFDMWFAAVSATAWFVGWGMSTTWRWYRDRHRISRGVGVVAG